MKIKTYDPKKDKEIVAGDFDADTGVFTKTVTKRHFMIREGGYAIQVEVMDILSRWECKQIIIRSKTKTYKVLFDIWYKNGTVKNYGHGDQSFFPVKFMNEEK